VSNDRLTPGEVQRRLVAALPTPRVVSEPLHHALVGRVAAVDVRSRIDVPAARNAAMDGYAVRAADVRGASSAGPVVLRVVGASAAGSVPAALPMVEAGSAVRIATGAPLPEGADAVVRQEDTDRGTSMVEIRNDRDLEGRANVRAAGEDWARGEVVVHRGDALDPVRLARLAAVGDATTLVTARPRVAIVSSGDELTTVDQFDTVLASGGARHVASSLYALAPMIHAAGGEVVRIGLAPDDRDALTRELRDTLASGVDLLITTGGISVGERDLTRELLTSLGGVVDGWRVSIRPGGPFGFGHVHDTRWLGLPGNPVSTLITFLLFGAPLIRALAGDGAPWPRPIRVRLDAPLQLGAPLTHYLRVHVTMGDDGVGVASLCGAQGSHLLSSMLDADALLVAPPSDAERPAGTMYWALPCSAAARGAREPLP
jgi:molybdopterin molybdotransferase